jgi:GntR family transcriptional regulator
MRFAVNPSSTEPVYAQIVRQVREAVARGVLRPGERIPSVRDLALQLVINPNTIAAAYREMERAGLVYSQRGKGTFVAEISNSSSAAERRRLLQKHVDALLTEATHLGFREEECLEMVRAAAKRYRLRESAHE